MHSNDLMLSTQDDDAYGERRTGEPTSKSTVEGAGGGDGSEIDPTSNVSPPAGSIQEGEPSGAGTYRCVYCGQQVTIGEQEPLPPCPGCSGSHSPSYYWPPA
ncbi:MAG TPA: hypothetical protein VHQ65_00230 [Thermoanaerobaculia bacterium]|nr:hypothetical protein [Thermoanaerobaculia bacterium]